MLKKLYFNIIILLSGINYLSANTNNICCPYYIRAELGESFSRCANTCIPGHIWDEVNEGYNNNLGKAPLAGFAFGVNLGNMVSLGVNYTYRGPFHYKKYQTPIVAVENIVNDTLVVARTRYFDFENNSYLIELFANRMGIASEYCWDFFYGSIAPYIGFGLGWSRNIVSNFHSVEDNTVSIGSFHSNGIASTMSYKATKSFSWSFSVGIEYNCDCLDLSIGYRYFDGGKFKSNNYITDNLKAADYKEIKVPAWRCKFTSNEVVASLSLNF